ATFFNNLIKDGAFGLYWSAGSPSTEALNVLNNQFINQYNYGAYIQNTAGLYFKNNVITSNSYSASYTGLYTYWLMTQGRDNQITGNRIYGDMTGYGMSLTYLSVNSSTASLVANNMVQMGNTSNS